ncbi:polyketide synthase [Saccharibacillus sacchari]|uniref:Polyketide synthase n=1 Tax=Saccharibacillus sacchari TaxID=456493 RepID=A0ACC6PJC0_9BACL
MNANDIRRIILEEIRSEQLTPEEGYELLSAFSEAHHALPETNDSPKSDISKDIAVIGISGRFPGAPNINDLWENLIHGVDSITEVPIEHWNVPQHEGYKKWAGLLDTTDHFDPLFFKISPNEAECMDPQQRLFLEEAWRAFEDAGYSASSLSGTNCGVFAGVLSNGYEQNLKKIGKEMGSNVLTGVGSAYLPGRVSYFLNLLGPNMAIDTACSSSLVAVHQACQSLRIGECEMALAGGVNVLVSPDLHNMANDGGMLAKNGRCKTFDNSADGFVPGEAVCAIVLKPLMKAIEDKDYIYGVIKGSGINQDGKTNGMTAPSSHSQSRLQNQVYEKFNLNPSHISYVEAHGTGTKLGDPIEVSALSQTFKNYTSNTGYCAIGSIKTNIGHTLAAAGIVSLIKVILCMKHKTLVPSLHYTLENEHLNLKHTPFYVNSKTKHWAKQGILPRTAAINSFGLSGTNCHVVVQEWESN